MTKSVKKLVKKIGQKNWLKKSVKKTVKKFGEKGKGT